uniref:Uncharacterized protein MANES_01G103000 n=1 Tax=Rhizophora mucronata TaxID=61149 RepID=A0A2P2LIK7_RHIMU
MLFVTIKIVFFKYHLWMWFG